MIQKNVLGGRLKQCCDDLQTGFYRTGCCESGPEDFGLHTVCTQVTREFLEFTRAAGNDLSRPAPGFPGLKPGDRWCVCASRWKEALDAGVAPPVYLESTHEATLLVVPLAELERYVLEQCDN